MSIRSHLLAAALPLVLVFTGAYAFQKILTGKVVEDTQIDIRLSKLMMRTCGVEKLRTFNKDVRVKDDSLGGVMAEFGGGRSMVLHIFSVSESRVRIQGSWRAQDDTPDIRNSYEKLSNGMAELLLQCNTSKSAAVTPNPSFEPTRSGKASLAFISFWAKLALPPRAAQLKR